MMRVLVVAVLVSLFCAPCVLFAEPVGSRVGFNEEGIALVDGKPFFPIGVFTYKIDPGVLAELYEVRCNTVLHGFNPDQLDLLHEHGLMAVCETSEPWQKAAVNHSALLAWYLTDEPENRGVTPASELQRYRELAAKDTKHPIGLCHTSYGALTDFKDACDFTMTDIYPITPNRDKDIMGVSVMMDEARRIHGANWPQWTYIQTFGGPEADNGVWAVPLPHEVRFMVYQALVHRATGILYFSYWPQAPRTWQAVAEINRELEQLVPRLVVPGKEVALKADNAAVQVRMRAESSGKAGVILAINTTPRAVRTTIHAEGAADELRVPFEGRVVQGSAGGGIAERFAPYGVHVYTWGAEPQVEMAREGR